MGLHNIWVSVYLLCFMRGVVWSVVSEDAPLWEPQAWDTPASYKAFKYYLDAEEGAGRLIRAYRQYRAEKGAKTVPKSVSGTWSEWSRGANPTSGDLIPNAVSWQERAKSYDTHLAKLEAEELAKKRAENRIKRVKMIEGLQNHLLIALSQLDFRPKRTVEGQVIQPTLPDFKDLVRALQVVNDEARKDYNDLPQQRVQHSTKDGRPLQTIEQTVHNQIGFDFSNYDDDDLDYLINQKLDALRKGAVSGSADREGGAEEGAGTPEADTSQEG